MSIENGCIEHQYYQTFARENEQSCLKNARRRKQKQQVELFLNILLKENSEAKVLFKKETY